MSNYQLFHGDCLEIMPTLSDASVDAIICDLPYGKTALKWDSVIPFEPLWKEYKRIIKPRGAIVLFGSQPFTSALITSNLKWFKYCWVWEKTVSASFFNAKNKPLTKHEDVCVFSDGTTANHSNKKMIYNPQGLIRTNREWHRPKKYGSPHEFDRKNHKLSRIIEFSGYPGSVLRYANNNNKSVHPTQKPVALLEYLVRTYTNEDDTVLDNTFGSATTGIACLNTGRSFIGIEKDIDYFNLGSNRMHERAKELGIVTATEATHG